MQVDTPDKIRNVAVAGHNDTGKTTLVSALLYAGGVTTRFTRVEDGNTITDFDHEETQRGISIGLAVCFVPWQQHKINLIDCPGYGIFFTETKAGMRAADAVLLCVNGVAGRRGQHRAGVGLRRGDRPAGDDPPHQDGPRAGRLRPRSRRAAQALRPPGQPIQVPIGSGAGFTASSTWCARRPGASPATATARPSPSPSRRSSPTRVAELRGQLVEAVAETDDKLMEGFFESGMLSQEDLEAGLRRAVVAAPDLPAHRSPPARTASAPRRCSTLCVEFLPSPAESAHFPAHQPRRRGDRRSPPIRTRRREALVFKTLSDPFTGKISILRVVSGTLASDTSAYNSRAEESERLGHLMELQGKQGPMFRSSIAGDIGGVAKLKVTATGDTLCAKERPLSSTGSQLPEPGMSLRGRAQVEGRRGEDRRRPGPPDRRGPDAHARPRPGDARASALRHRPAALRDRRSPSSSTATTSR